MAFTKPSTINSLWATSGTRIAPPPSKRSLGWIAEKPSYQYFNDILYRLGQADAYLNSRGIAEWDNETEYVGEKSYIVGSNGSLYKCLVTNTNQNPVLDDGTYWKIIANGQGSEAWNILFTYKAGALVLHDDELWLATNDSTGVEPASSVTEWDKIVRSNDLGTSAYLSTSDVYNASNLSSGTVASARLPNSTTSVRGVVELATQTEVDAGTDTSRVVTPSTLANSELAADVYNASKLATGTVPSARLPNSSTSVKGAVELATQVEVDAGTDASRVVTPSTLANSELAADVADLSVANNDGTKAALNASGSAPIYACRAWGNLDGLVATPIIRNGGNFSGVTKLASGKYRVTMSQNAPHSNYHVSVNAAQSLTSAESVIDTVLCLNQTTSTFDIWTSTSDTGYQDCELVSFAVTY